MNDIVSEKVLARVPGGKYSRWAAGLSTEHLELLLWVVGVYADEYNKAKSRAGISPTQLLTCYRWPLERMFIALDKISVLQAGGDFEERVLAFSPPATGPAFSEPYRKRLAASESHLSWAADLSEDQLFVLLWQVGEHAIRVNMRWQDQDYPYAFILLPQSEEIMQRALDVLVAIFRREGIDVAVAKKQVLR